MRIAIVSLILVIGLAGCSFASDFTIDNCPTKQTEVLITNDLELLKQIYQVFPSHKKKLMPLNIWIANTEGVSALTIFNGKVQITTQNNRGIWLHELCHYFTNQLDSSDANEFAHEVLENIANGMSADTYKKYFVYNGFAYRNRKSG